MREVVHWLGLTRMQSGTALGCHCLSCKYKLGALTGDSGPRVERVCITNARQGYGSRGR